MKKIIKNILILTFISLMLGSCKFTNFDLTESPNYLKPDEANLDYVLNSMQINMIYFLNDPDPVNNNGMNKFGMEVTRMTYLFGGTYLNAYDSQWFNAVWWSAYSSFLMDANTLIPQAEENGWYIHTGMAKVMQAYILATLVDFFGPVPFSEAFDATNFNPGVDNGDVLYQVVLDLLDDAITDFAKESTATPEFDLFYNGETDYWITLAKTLKLKMYLNLRLTDPSGSASAVNALIAENDLIDTEAEDFVFQYSANAVNPDCRHPYYTYNYLNGANDYMTNYLMWLMYTEKPVIDPRIRYYFYRQTLTISTDINELPCINTDLPAHYDPDMVFCHATDGYWGRDHLDDDGIPPDNDLRTVFGLYPAGGLFDNDLGDAARNHIGASGAGLEVIMLSSFVDFMLAEAALTLGTTGDARTLLLSGVQKSIDKVTGFRTDMVDAAYAATAGDISDYLTEVGTLYDAATTNAERLNVIAKEYYIALFGNGVETYNLVRRTTYPSNLQPALEPNPGAFYYTLYYPSDCVNLNSSINQKTTPATQVFWDNNTVGDIE
ncbi:MAG: SusD/RagB family nutrient-binding outer membrane lipoprotein [Bacteroidales bacterium]|nr:SusD/RagB family nutrient-binding outer membrane lipoprotein [Bacteroidales bacterium]